MEILGVKPLLIIATTQKTRSWTSTLWRLQDSFSKTYLYDSWYVTVFRDTDRLQHTLTRETVNSASTPASWLKPFIIWGLNDRNFSKHTVFQTSLSCYLLNTINTSDFILWYIFMCGCCYMFRPLSGRNVAVKVHKNQNYNCSISYERSDWNLGLWRYKMHVNKNF
jgi:hypothetical protein